MRFDKYQEEAHKTAVYQVNLEFTPREIGVLYAALGLANEAGEVAGKIKKFLVRDRQEYGLTPEQIKIIGDEIGDVFWYMNELATMLDLDMEEIAMRNLDKLSDRQERGVLHGDGDKR